MPKYDSLRKTKRDAELIKFAREHRTGEKTDLSMNEIGQKYNISESRVSKILKANGVK